MDKHYKNIRMLIENNLVEIKKNEISSNSHTLLTYYNIGKEITEAQGGKTRAKYGTALIKEYSVLLEKEYGAKYGRSNLMLMRQLFLTFPKVHTVYGQLSWSMYKEILPIKNKNKRNYYINSVVEHNFSVRQLREYIKTNAYERLVKKDNIKLKYIDQDEKK